MVKSTDRTANSVMFSNLRCLLIVSVVSRGQSVSELWGQFLSCGHRSGTDSTLEALMNVSAFTSFLWKSSELSVLYICIYIIIIL
jgi:hypothetical protein